jgi:hypothetical protein
MAQLAVQTRVAYGDKSVGRLGNLPMIAMVGPNVGQFKIVVNNKG